MSPKNPIVPGVTSGLSCSKKSRRYGYVLRGPEDILIENEKSVYPTLCVRAKLPEGISCNLRIENKGFFFCSNKNSTCPLSKERV